MFVFFWVDSRGSFGGTYVYQLFLLFSAVLAVVVVLVGILVSSDYTAVSRLEHNLDLLSVASRSMLGRKKPARNVYRYARAAAHDRRCARGLCIVLVLTAVVGRIAGETLIRYLAVYIRMLVRS